MSAQTNAIRIYNKKRKEKPNRCVFPPIIALKYISYCYKIKYCECATKYKL